MSSITAAPSTIWLSGSCSRPRSLSTRAVMPTLVAVKAAPATMHSILSWPKKWQTRYPPAKGSTTPTIGHRGRRRAGPQQLDQVGFQPDLEQENHHADFLQEMEDGRLRPVVIARIDQPQDGSPQETPARSSPSTAGWPIARAADPKSRAAASTMARMPSSCTI